MTKPLAPRLPAPTHGEPTTPPVMISPRVSLAAAMIVALLAAAFAFAFKPAKAHLPAAEQVAASHYSVQMANYAYAPAAITVNEGDTITWTNQDTAPHTVTTTSGPQQLNSPYLSKGQSWSFTFSAPGMYMYYCTVHPDMRAEVIVKTPAPATSAAAPASPRQQQHTQQHTQQQQTQNPSAANGSQGGGAMPAHTSKPSMAMSSAPPASSSQASAAAAGGPAATPSGPAGAAQLQSQQTADSSSIRTLSPVLLLGGMTTAIAVFCLLLVGSRASGGQPRPAPAATASHDSDDDEHEDY